ncbi:NAD+ synthase [Pseudodesulfovibrio tunisiensis]|uniref:NAD+ synthase n=1 Tax=Pseudodesulfovibrio tunisiensis TaxID=463192 RepID=UPI001FB32450|nr:NAD+ synthase [Pseudodesulfovibrio tunisiensis]
MKIGVLQLNPLVGDLDANADRIVRAAREAAQQGADFSMTPELALCGYPPRDLLLYERFTARVHEVAQRIARELADLPPLLLGAVCPNESGPGKPVFNCAYWCESGRIAATVRKTLLPTYDVFDEARYFEPAPESDGSANIVEFRGRKIAVTVCEDAWNDKEFWEKPPYGRDPLELAARHAPDVIVNLSASPFSLGKQAVREKLLGTVAARHAIPLIYANQIGGNDDLVFDGRSCAFGPDGSLTFRAPGFEEAVSVVDTDAGGTVADDDFSQEAETWRALVLGTRDYARKSGFSKALLGLSGGIDSAVTAVVAAHALGPDNVLCVLMPSPYSSRGSVDDSLQLARNLRTATMTLPIEPAMKAMDSTLSEAFQGCDPDTTEENIQSRIRGNLLMALSNKYRSLLLTTGNKSELAVGYCTIYGDMSGGFAVISDVPKVAVYKLARWINANLNAPIPEDIITKPPSAELRPDQKDQDSLPDYEILDAILEMHIEGQLSEQEIVERGFDAATVHRILHLVNIAEFKRRQAAPGIKITPRSFGTGWRMPLACRRDF